MGLREMLLIFLGVGIVAFFTYQRVLRAVFFVLVLWSAGLMSALVYESAAFRMKALLMNRPLTEGWLFIIFMALFAIAGYAFVYKAFPDTKLPKIGILDYILGFVVALVLALVIVSLLLNSVGVMVREQWDTNRQGWVNLQFSYSNSMFLPVTRQIMSIYSLTYRPFFRFLPPVLTPQ